MAIPDWRPPLRPGGFPALALVHPAFEQLLRTWREHGDYRVLRYLDGYGIAGLVSARRPPESDALTPPPDGRATARRGGRPRAHGTDQPPWGEEE
ncbi:hypothetical protein ACL02R_01065 [Streptomyces sp. MS19]|uniref:hypothetical protein n=1 Tax=Streptomyces sp. MS19 TaxID=3385972 RepID=UPI0039A20418